MEKDRDGERDREQNKQFKKQRDRYLKGVTKKTNA